MNEGRFSLPAHCTTACTYIFLEVFQCNSTYLFNWMGLGWAWMERQKLVEEEEDFCWRLCVHVCFCEAEGWQGVQAEGRLQIFDQLPLFTPHLQGLAEPSHCMDTRTCFPCDVPSEESWGQGTVGLACPWHPPCFLSSFFPQEWGNPAMKVPLPVGTRRQTHLFAFIQIDSKIWRVNRAEYLSGCYCRPSSLSLD